MIVKVKFIRNGEPYGRGYTYSAPDSIRFWDMVEVPTGSVGIVTAVMSGKTKEDFPYTVKDIVRVIEKKESEEMKNDSGN